MPNSTVIYPDFFRIVERKSNGWLIKRGSVFYKKIPIATSDMADTQLMYEISSEQIISVFRRQEVEEDEEEEGEPEADEEPKPFVCVHNIDGEEFDANFRNAQGVSFRDIVFAGKARLGKLRKTDSQFAKQRWFDSVNYRPQYDLPY